MKGAALALFLLLWQGGFQHEGEVSPAPEHFHYVRTLSLPAGSSGQACAVLDAVVFAHADEALNGLRLYADGREVPFVVTKSGEAEQETEAASVLFSEKYDGKIVFELKMPSRPYTEVDLRLAGHDFLGTATVFGKAGSASTEVKELGKYEVFDLTGQRLGQSFSLPLQEETFPVLRVELEIHPLREARGEIFDTGMVSGAIIPPTREAQTLYTPVAETHRLTEGGSVASFAMLPHVPVERVSFHLKPGFTRNFMLPVTLTTKSAEAGDSPDAAEILGNVHRVVMPAGVGGLEIHEQQLSLPIETMANMRGTALIELKVGDGRQEPVPFDAVTLEMRQREICFESQPNKAYELRYGDDAAVRAPVYPEAQLFHLGGAAIPATMLAETENPGFVGRQDERTYRERHPELLWIGMIAVVAVLGGTAIHNVKAQGRPR